MRTPNRTTLILVIVSLVGVSLLANGSKVFNSTTDAAVVESTPSVVGSPTPTVSRLPRPTETKKPRPKQTPTAKDTKKGSSANSTDNTDSICRISVDLEQKASASRLKITAKFSNYDGEVFGKITWPNSVETVEFRVGNNIAKFEQILDFATTKKPKIELYSSTTMKESQSLCSS